jgi:hypothetical protein
VRSLAAAVLAGSLVSLGSLGPLVMLPAPAALAADKPRHDLQVSSKEIGGDTDRFKMFGSVPTYAGAELRIQRKVDKAPFKAWSTELTATGTGRFSFRIYGGKRGSTVCYRVVVPATAEHRRTKGQRWCIETEAGRSPS